jgi:hypothetical protein
MRVTMTLGHRLLRAASSLAAIGLVVGAVEIARAEPSPPAPAPDRATCHAAYEQGQRLRRSKKLSAARARFVVCARDPCPAAFQADCAAWLGEVSIEEPTVVVEVRRRGALAPDSRVLLDGAPFLEKIDGVARPLDPGEHEFKVIAANGAALVRRQAVVEGVKAQRIVFDIDPIPDEPAPARRAPPSPLVIGLASLGGVALASFGVFGISGLGQKSEIDKCDPFCSKRDVDAAQRTLLIADISLGVAVVALSSAAVLFFTQARTSPRPVALQGAAGAAAAVAR